MTIPSLTVSSARTRLALTYLGIIMALTLGFSTIFYYQTMSAARNGFRTQENQLRGNLYFLPPQGLDRIREEGLRRFRNNLLAKLVLVNASMLAAGSAASYFLARRSLRPLEQALVTQGRFTSDAAHELRTPLAAMKLENELGLRDKKLQVSGARDIMTSNLEEIAKLEALTNGLLRLARSGDKIDTSQWQDYKLQDILDAAAGRLADKAAANKMTLNLPKTKAVVHGDPDQLIELFVPIIGNAIKYSSGKSSVDVTVTQPDKKVRVDIADKGIGITEVDLPHIFDRFYRADQSRNKTKADGYGLGLSLAQAIAQAHRGKITVKSEYGRGSVFSVELPLAG